MRRRIGFGSYLADATNAIFSSFAAVGDALGISTSGLSGMSVSIGEIDTSGMSPDEISAAIEARFAAEMDAIANVLFGSLAEFQRAGEGMAETAIRVSVTFDQVAHALSLLDMSVDWRTANIIADVAGGIDALNVALSGYTQNFFTDAEQVTMMYDTMSVSFRELRVAMPKTNEEFRAFVESIDTTTSAGATLFAEMMLLADGFNELTTAQDDLNASNEEANSLLADQQALFDAKMKLAQDELAFHKDILGRIESAYTGSASYLNSVQQASLLGGIAAAKLESGDTQGYFDTLYAQLGQEKVNSSTIEDYAVNFDSYISTLQNAEYEPATTADVVAGLETILEQNKRIESAIEGASYQAPLSTSYAGV